MRITILGANGPTGRLLTQQAVAAGHNVVALTRRPDEFPMRHPKLVVEGGDVLNQDAVDPVVDGSDAVLSALGTPFSKEELEVYSRGGHNTLAAMKRFGTPRLVVVTSGAVTGQPEPTGGFLFNRVLQPYVMRVLGKTVYDDMRRLEELLSLSDTEWTVLRPSGLFELPDVTKFSITEEHGPGRLTSRRDLAAAMLEQVTDQRFVRKVAHVITTQDNPSLLSMIWREARKK
ncbi:NAD(P)-dependent oxidoreductase [Kribbella pratensis]|jgi:putative NADH-flavin reductase|uniref:NADH-flavin reductase n=1 Tax=Kribbella pratensis TaxID=2512112 RepID=A0A4R8CP90_9ACTN|nr:NAD(P)H-binding protein [Kribbella pratensis]TDW77952.1 putative NADH-flavin reductase [Kribbella pratensis]